MSIQHLTVVTGNKRKAAEIAAITGLTAESVELDIPEIQSLDVEIVAKEKALAAYARLHRPVVVDDTGMVIDALGGLPGALVAWFLDKLGAQGILNLVRGNSERGCSVMTCIGFADEGGAVTFVGTVKGRLAEQVQGDHGFGYDSIFIPDGQDRTYAQMTAEEKNATSMRKLALLDLKKHLEHLNR